MPSRWFTMCQFISLLARSCAKYKQSVSIKKWSLECDRVIHNQRDRHTVEMFSLSYTLNSSWRYATRHINKHFKKKQKKKQNGTFSKETILKPYNYRYGGSACPPLQETNTELTWVSPKRIFRANLYTAPTINATFHDFEASILP